MTRRDNDTTDDQEAYERHLDVGLAEASEALSEHTGDEQSPSDAATGGWKAAAELVREFRPVPWVIWRIVRAVYGRADRIGAVGAGAFLSLDRLIFRASSDSALAASRADADVSVTRFDQAVDVIGVDVAGAICFIHAVCRRLQQTLVDRIAGPLLDDALLRAKIGYYVGKDSTDFGCGRGMLAGFSGRSGLAILIASGSTESAQDALRLMAQGVDIRDVGIQVYGSEPLQVSALALALAGCNREAAFGIASYGVSSRIRDFEAESISHRWLAAFSITEHLRMGTRDQIDPQHWQALGYDGGASKSVEELYRQTRLLQRRGHDWRWLAWSQLMMEEQKEQNDQGDIDSKN